MRNSNGADRPADLEQLAREAAAAVCKEINAREIAKLGEPRTWFDLHGATAYLAVSEQTLSRYVKENTAPPSVKVGKGRRFHRSDLDAWIRAGGLGFQEGGRMNEKLHPNLFVFDRARTADGLLFATGGDRCRYLGKSSREKPDWLKQNEGRYRRSEDVLRDDARGTPTVEAEIKLDAGPAEPVDSSASPEVRNDGDNKDDVASANALLEDRARPRESTSPPTPVEENAKKKKPPTGNARSTPKLSPKIMRIVLNSLRKCPIRCLAALAAGIHPKTLAYWIRRSKAGDDGYDLKWQGITQRFHEHCESAIDEAHQMLLDSMRQRALFGYDKVLTHRGRVVYKIDQELVGLGLQGPDAYLRDENGKPVPETVHKVDLKAMRFVLEWYRPETWGKHSKRNAPREGGVLIIGDVTKKPEHNTAASAKARKWKSGSKKIREAKA